MFVSHLAAKEEVQMQMQAIYFKTVLHSSSVVILEKLINQLRMV
jgi:hypothetical protein